MFQTMKIVFETFWKKDKISANSPVFKNIFPEDLWIFELCVKVLKELFF